VIARFVGGDASVLSGVMRGADQIRNRPMIVDAPSGKGHALLFTNNPDLPVADIRRTRNGVQTPDVLERLPGEAPPAKPVPTAQ
jgi:hypothetical protein